MSPEEIERRTARAVRIAALEEQLLAVEPSPYRNVLEAELARLQQAHTAQQNREFARAMARARPRE